MVNAKRIVAVLCVAAFTSAGAWAQNQTLDRSNNQAHNPTIGSPLPLEANYNALRTKLSTLLQESCPGTDKNDVNRQIDQVLQTPSCANISNDDFPAFKANVRRLAGDIRNGISSDALQNLKADIDQLKQFKSTTIPPFRLQELRRRIDGLEERLADRVNVEKDARQQGKFSSFGNGDGSKKNWLESVVHDHPRRLAGIAAFAGLFIIASFVLSLLAFLSCRKLCKAVRVTPVSQPLAQSAPESSDRDATGTLQQLLEKVSTKLEALTSRLENDSPATGRDVFAPVHTQAPSANSDLGRPQDLSPPPVVHRPSLVDIFNDYKAGGLSNFISALNRAGYEANFLSCVNQCDSEKGVLRFRKDDRGFYVLVKEKNGVLYLLPVPSYALSDRSAVQGLFKLRNGGFGSARLVKAAQLRAIAGGEYEVAEQGEVHV